MNPRHASHGRASRRAAARSLLSALAMGFFRGTSAPQPETLQLFGRGSAAVFERQFRDLASHLASLQLSKRPAKNTKRREVRRIQSFRLAGPTGLERATPKPFRSCHRGERAIHESITPQPGRRRRKPGRGRKAAARSGRGTGCDGEPGRRWTTSDPPPALRFTSARPFWAEAGGRRRSFCGACAAASASSPSRADASDRRRPARRSPGPSGTTRVRL